MKAHQVIVIGFTVLAVAACTPDRSGARATSSSTVPVSPGPTSVQELCDAQTWPRAVPDVVGRLLFQARDGVLSCFDNLSGAAPDGHDPLHRPTRPDEKTYRITAVSPGVGMAVGRHDRVTVELGEVAEPQPAVFRPCDWVTAAEAGDIMGGPVTAEPAGDQPGSVDVACLYDRPVDVGEGVEIDLQMPGAFAVDAESEFRLATATPPVTGVDGVGAEAACVDEATTTPPSTTLVVLLSGARLLRVTQGYALCTTLKRFAQLAIARIGD